MKVEELNKWQLEGLIDGDGPTAGGYFNNEWFDQLAGKQRKEFLEKFRAMVTIEVPQ